MIMTLEEAFLRLAASRAVRGLAPVAADAAMGSDSGLALRTGGTWVPEPRVVQGGTGTIRTGRRTGELLRVPENPLAAAQRPLYGGAFVAIPGLLMKSGAPSDYAGVTIEWAKAAVMRHNGSSARSGPGDLESESPRSMTFSARPSASSFSDEQVAAAAAEVAETEIRGAVQSTIVRACGEVKKIFTDRYFRSLLHADMFSTHPSSTGPSGNKTGLATLPLYERLALACALGAGDFRKLREAARSSSVAAWSTGLHQSFAPPVNPFASWRSQSVSDLQSNVRDIREALRASDAASGRNSVPSDPQDVCESTSQLSCVVAEDSWGAQRDARQTHCENFESDTSGAVDRLFLNSHAVAAMQAFIGFPGMRSGSIANGTLSGPTSVLSIARADAWMATVVTVTRHEVEEELRIAGKTPGQASIWSQGKRNSRFNAVFGRIFPLAVEALLRELRSLLEEWSGNDEAEEARVPLTPHALELGLNGRSVELHAPFFPGVAEELRTVFTCLRKQEAAAARKKAVEEEHGADVGDEAAIKEAEEKPGIDVSEAAYSACETQLVDDNFHHGDVFLGKGRKATTAFAIGNTRTSEGGGVEHFIVLKPGFFRSTVCYWLGDVLDAYVGRWNASSQQPVSCESSVKKGAVWNGTLYGPMLFCDLPTHLDSQSRQSWDPSAAQHQVASDSDRFHDDNDDPDDPNDDYLRDRCRDGMNRVKEDPGDLHDGVDEEDGDFDMDKVKEDPALPSDNDYV